MGATRQRASLDAVGFDGTYKAWINEYPPGCPSHQQTPYAFKPHAFKWAAAQGYDEVLWMDSAVWAQHDLKPIWDKIDHDGYFVLQNGWTSGHWCSDRQLEAFGLTREQAFEIPHPMACVVGVNIRHAKGIDLLHDYYKYIDLFPGPWTNDGQQVSKHPDVLGTRHDQAVLGLIMHKYKLNYTYPQGWIEYLPSRNQQVADESVLLTQGM